MQLWSFIAVIGRRWRVVVPVLALTVVLCVMVVLTAKPNYEVTGTQVMLIDTPPTTADGRPINPWMSADSSASQFASLMIDGASGHEFEARAGTVGVPKSWYVITADATRPAVVELTITAPSEAQALDAYTKLLGEFRREVEERQTALNAPKETRYSMIDLTVPTEAKVIRTRTKLAIGLVGVGVIAALFAAAVAELGSAVRRTRREAGSDVSFEPARSNGARPGRPRESVT